MLLVQNIAAPLALIPGWKVTDGVYREWSKPYILNHARKDITSESLKFCSEVSGFCAMPLLCYQTRLVVVNHIEDLNGLHAIVFVGHRIRHYIGYVKFDDLYIIPSTVFFSGLVLLEYFHSRKCFFRIINGFHIQRVQDVKSLSGHASRELRDFIVPSAVKFITLQQIKVIFMIYRFSYKAEFKAGSTAQISTAKAILKLIKIIDTSGGLLFAEPTAMGLPSCFSCSVTSL